MARLWSSSSRLCLGLVLLCLSLCSCLELGVSVDFRTSTTGQIKVDALSYRLAQGISVVEGTDRIPFPATRAEWQTVVDQIPGATLVSWTGTEEDLGFRTSAVLGFASARALEGLFVVFKQKLTLLQDIQGRWTLTFVPQVPRVTAADPQTRRLWSALWGPVVWTFAFAPPDKPRAERAVTLADLAGDKAPSEWQVTW